MSWIKGKGAYGMIIDSVIVDFLLAENKSIFS